MDNLQKNITQQLNELHLEIEQSSKATILKAIEAGELLNQVKDSLKHGEFTDWVKMNVTFDIRTAQRYMKAFNKRHLLKNDTVSSLRELIEEPKKEVESSGDKLPKFARPDLIPDVGKYTTIFNAYDEYEMRTCKIMAIARISEQPEYVITEKIFHDDGDGQYSIFDKRGKRWEYAFLGMDLNKPNTQFFINDDFSLFLFAKQ